VKTKIRCDFAAEQEKAAIGKREKGWKHRMTLAALSECLGVPRRTLYRYRKDHPAQAPRSFDDLEGWIEFVGKVKNYRSERTRPRDRDGSESSAEDQNGEYGEYSAAVERRERIFKSRLGNEVRRSSLERLRRNTVTTAECEATMDRIRAVVSVELLKLPASLCHGLAHREPRHIQQVLDAAFRSSLERLNRLENYL
jgi:hypothetical protein